ncbi:MAG: hypothetical protein ACLRWQ_12810 [Flavonifractor plautii]
MDRAAEMGDSVVMDYEGVRTACPSRAALPRATSWRWAPTPSFPASRSSVVGMKAGEEKDHDLTFPEDYHAKRSGRPAGPVQGEDASR